MAKKTTVKRVNHVWCLAVESADGTELFPIRDHNWKRDKAHIDKNFTETLFSMTPPPKVHVKKLTLAQWKKAERIGRAMA